MGSRKLAATASGEEVLSRLRYTGDVLNSIVQQILPRVNPAARQQLSGAFHGNADWPAVAPPVEVALSQLKSLWSRTRHEIEGYAASVFGQQRGTNNPTTAADYERHFISVVCARLVLEPVSEPEALQCDAARRLQLGAAHVGMLKRSGCSVLSGALDTAGIDARALHGEMQMLFEHGVIAPTRHTCNPGAHGIMLRCGTETELDSFRKQRTPELLKAILLLRGLPHTLAAAGYQRAQQVPGSVLLSAYPPGAHYTRHLDNYGTDNRRELTLYTLEASNPHKNPHNTCDKSLDARAACSRAGAPESQSPLRHYYTTVTAIHRYTTVTNRSLLYATIAPP